jgi:predicted NACHT family NTPase
MNRYRPSHQAEMDLEDIWAYLALNFAIALDLTFAIALAPEFQATLQDLKAQLSNFEKNLSASKKWWQTQAQNWTEKLKDVMIKHRNIGHNWSFTPTQCKLLQQYLEANLLLVNCLNSSCSVTPSVRVKIEDTLLLPIAEIERRKLARMSETPSPS